MQRKLTSTHHAEQAKYERAYWLGRTPEEPLDAVEALRIEAARFG